MHELDCMRTIEEALTSIGDDAARVRVLGWLFSKYLADLPQVSRPADAVANRLSQPLVSGVDGRPNEIPGIGRLSPTGDLQITIRDLKAASANDAAVRLVHVIIWAAAKLAGESAVSSKHVVLPLLRKYRCYDGNTRKAIAAEKGIVRDGDTLSLDFHSEQYAEKVVEQILDASFEGKWKPGSTKRRTSRFAYHSSEAQ